MPFIPSFCDVKLGESMFRDARSYFNSLTRNSEAFSLIAARLKDSIFLTDEELYTLLCSYIKKEYLVKTAAELTVQQRIDTARYMHFNYNASNQQLRRMLRIDNAILEELFPWKITLTYSCDAHQRSTSTILINDTYEQYPSCYASGYWIVNRPENELFSWIPMVDRRLRPRKWLFFWPLRVNCGLRPRKGPFFCPAAVGIFSVGAWSILGDWGAGQRPPSDVCASILVKQLGCRVSIATLAYVAWYKFDRNFAICQKIKNFDRRVKAPGLRLLCGVLYALP